MLTLDESIYRYIIYVTTYICQPYVSKGSIWKLLCRPIDLRPLVPYFDRVAQGKMWSEAELLNDGDLATGLLLQHAPGQARSAYVGVDFLSVSTWVKCVKLMQGPMPQEYVRSARWESGSWRAIV